MHTRSRSDAGPMVFIHANTSTRILLDGRGGAAMHRYGVEGRDTFVQLRVR